MDAGLRTPLLEFFRRGDVAHDVRLLAAQGALAPRALEQLGLLVLLVSDEDPDIARCAESTLRAIPARSLEAFLARADVPAQMRDFFAGRGVTPADVPAEDGDLLIGDSEDWTEAPNEEDSSDAANPRPQTVQKIAAMSIPERVKLAMKGTKEERAVLVRDSNKIVAVAVLSSPKLGETEVTNIARMTNVSDEILRIIAQTRSWVKNYSTCLALTRNPKTPLAVSMNLLSRINEKDLRMLSIDRNVPDTLRLTARKKLVIDK